MNKRIQELIKQSTHVEEPDGLFPREVFDKEKFAELIVAECLTFVEPMPGSGDIDDIALQGAYNQIKQHFGVE